MKKLKESRRLYRSWTGIFGCFVPVTPPSSFQIFVFFQVEKQVVRFRTLFDLPFGVDVIQHDVAVFTVKLHLTLRQHSFNLSSTKQNYISNMDMSNSTNVSRINTVFTLHEVSASRRHTVSDRKTFPRTLIYYIYYIRFNLHKSEHLRWIEHFNCLRMVIESSLKTVRNY